jgi:hypothetical protein
MAAAALNTVDTLSHSAVDALYDRGGPRHTLRRCPRQAARFRVSLESRPRARSRSFLCRGQKEDGGTCWIALEKAVQRRGGSYQPTGWRWVSLELEKRAACGLGGCGRNADRLGGDRE